MTTPSKYPQGADTAGTARIAALDVLRGFALGGILAVNILGMANLFDPGSSAVADVVHLLFEGKFYVLFSFLFGYSFTLQLRTARRDGASTTAGRSAAAWH
jgi:uncharacterized protein